MRFILGSSVVLVCALAVAATGAVAQRSEVTYDEETKLVSFVDLVYPPVGLMGRVQGVVVVQVALNGDGSVVQASAVSGSKILIPYCLDNARQWKFVANRERRAVIVYDFEIDSGACHERQRSVFLLKHQNFASIVACSLVGEG